MEPLHLEVPPVPLRSNPFLIAVLVIAVALIGAGVLIGSRIDLWYDDVSPDGPGLRPAQHAAVRRADSRSSSVRAR